jgi:hypothetical protein
VLQKLTLPQVDGRKTWYEWRYFNVMQRVHCDANFTYYKNEAWIQKFKMAKVDTDDIKV